MLKTAATRKDKSPTPVAEFACDASKSHTANRMVFKHAFHIF